MKILIVEDDKFLNKVYGQFLKRENYEIDFMFSGKGVLEKAKEFKPDLVLLDIIMPEEDGFEVIKNLKNDSETKNVPVVVITALSQEEDLQKLKALGASEYFIKTDIEFKEIVKIIEKYSK